MNTISRDDLRQLAGMDGEYVVSIYMPASVGADSRQNPVRFKNLLRVAGQKMLRPEDWRTGHPKNDGLRTARCWTSPISGKNCPTAWRCFVSRDNLRVWPLPFACEELCVVGKHAYLLPLLSWETNDPPYFVLAVSQNAVRLLAGTRARIEEVTVPNLPANLTTALHYDTRQGTLQMHSGTTATRWQRGRRISRTRRRGRRGQAGVDLVLPRDRSRGGRLSATAHGTADFCRRRLSVSDLSGGQQLSEPRGDADRRQPRLACRVGYLCQRLAAGGSCHSRA